MNNITHTKGDTFTRKLVFKDKDGNLINLSNQEITMTIKDKPENDIPIIQTQAQLIDPNHPENGETEIVIDANTLNIDPGQYVYDIQWNQGNKIRTIDKGTFTIIYDITN